MEQHLKKNVYKIMSRRALEFNKLLSSFRQTKMIIISIDCKCVEIPLDCDNKNIFGLQYIEIINFFYGKLFKKKCYLFFLELIIIIY